MSQGSSSQAQRSVLFFQTSEEGGDNDTSPHAPAPRLATRDPTNSSDLSLHMREGSVTVKVAHTVVLPSRSGE